MVANSNMGTRILFRMKNNLLKTISGNNERSNVKQLDT